MTFFSLQVRLNSHLLTLHSLLTGCQARGSLKAAITNQDRDHIVFVKNRLVYAISCSAYLFLCVVDARISFFVGGYVYIFVWMDGA